MMALVHSVCIDATAVILFEYRLQPKKFYTTLYLEQLIARSEGELLLFRLQHIVLAQMSISFQKLFYLISFATLRH